MSFQIARKVTFDQHRCKKVCNKVMSIHKDGKKVCHRSVVNGKWLVEVPASLSVLMDDHYVQCKRSVEAVRFHRLLEAAKLV